MFVMLNPSTADASTDDPTIRRCRGFARREGASRLVVVNLFTERATKPSSLFVSADPVGPDADEALRRAMALVDVSAGDLVVCAWGAAPAGAPPGFRALHRERAGHVMGLAEAMGVPLKALGLTSGGQPRHPLYVRGDAPLLPFGRGG